MHAEAAAQAGRDTSAATAIPADPWARRLADARAEVATLRTVRDLVRICESVLTLSRLWCGNSMGSQRQDARAIVFETLAISDHAAQHLDAAVLPSERDTILDLLERRVATRTPLPYLLGEAFYAGLRFDIRPGVFVPRNALRYRLDDVLASVTWSPEPRVLDLGCGTGATGITIALRVPEVRVDLVDIDPLAVEVAAGNAVRHRVAQRVRAHVGDLFDGVAADVRYDLIVTNLPYVPDALADRGGAGGHAEPLATIFRPGDGLDLVRAVVASAPDHLADSGTLAFEVGPDQIASVRWMLAERGTWWSHEGRSLGLVTIGRRDLVA